MELYLLLLVVGALGGFLAGLVGLGGGIILAPLLLYAPPAFGLSPLDMKEVARLTIIQTLCSIGAAGLAHRRARQTHWQLVMWMGGPMAVASLCGAMSSELQLVSSRLLLGLLATMAVGASLLMVCFPVEKQDEGKALKLNEFSFSRPHAIAVAVGVGFLGGMVGQGGGYLTIPLLIYFFKMPTRLAIGSSLWITFCAALAASTGKLFGGGSIAWIQVIVLVVGSLVGSQLGARLSHRVRTRLLRYVLAVLIGAGAIGMWYQVLN